MVGFFLCVQFSVQPGLDAGPDHPVPEIAAAPCPGDVHRPCPSGGSGGPCRATAVRASGGPAGGHRADDASSSGGPRLRSDDDGSLRCCHASDDAPLPCCRAGDDAFIRGANVVLVPGGASTEGGGGSAGRCHKH